MKEPLAAASSWTVTVSTWAAPPADAMVTPLNGLMVALSPTVWLAAVPVIRGGRMFISTETL